MSSFKANYCLSYEQQKIKCSFQKGRVDCTHKPCIITQAPSKETNHEAGNTNTFLYFVKCPKVQSYKLA